MGKGGGCVPSKTPKPHPTTITTPASVDHPPASPPSSTPTTSESAIHPPIIPPRKLNLFIVFYSTYGHTETLARRIKLGADSVPDVQSTLLRVPETLSPDTLAEMRAPQRTGHEEDEVQEIVRVEELEECDGVLFGFPTRFGAMAAQMKAFFDRMGGVLWEGQRLAGKPAGFFVSTGTQGGGQETTAWTAITQLAHHGMLYVPIGYTFGAGMFKMDSIRGGSPYGAGVFAGDGTREPSDTELSLAEHQGKYMAAIMKKLAQR
ncbi:putative NAD(P)H dehydrogenase (quinone) FQR1-like 2 [Drosera capensis]